MMFIVTYLGDDQCPEDFAFQLKTFEQGLDFISKLVVRGQILLKVISVDKNSLVQLPIYAFDGADFSQPMKELEAQWKAVLATPISVHTVPGKWVTRWIERCDVLIVQQQHLIASITYLLEELESMPVAKRLKGPSLGEHRLALLVHESQLARLCTLRHWLKQRRDRLSETDD